MITSSGIQRPSCRLQAISNTRYHVSPDGKINRKEWCACSGAPTTLFSCISQQYWQHLNHTKCRGSGGDKEWMLMDNSLPALLVCPLSICMTTHNEKQDGSLTEVSDYFVLEEKKKYL